MLQLCDCHSHIQTAHPHPPQTATLRPPFRSRAVHTGYNIHGWEDGCQEKACTGSGSRLRTLWTRNSRTIAFQQWPGSGGLNLKWCLPQLCSILFVQEGTARGRPGQGPLLPGSKKGTAVRRLLQKSQWRATRLWPKERKRDSSWEDHTGKISSFLETTTMWENKKERR